MNLNLYRRHRPECEAHRPWQSRSSEFDERRKDWGSKCACQIHISGTLDGKFSRKPLARRIGLKQSHRRGLRTGGLLDGSAQAEGDAGRAPACCRETPHHDRRRLQGLHHESRVGGRRTGDAAEVPDVCEADLRIRRESRLRDARPVHARRHRPLLGQLEAGCPREGKASSQLRAFFRFSVNRKWIPESPVSSDIKAPVGSSRGANKAPFTDDELQRIIGACDDVKVEWKNETGLGVWTGEDLKDLIWLMVYTGFRISDATFFNINRLRGNEVFIRATKNGGDVFAYIPDWLRDHLRARAEHFGERAFIVGKSKRLETVTNVWRRRIAKAFEAAGSFDEPATPHRFRHTFARMLLEKGVPVADVADLLGDDEKTVREHYARWVPERQARLTKILKEAFSDKPRLTAIQGGRA
jgi:integrase